MTPSPSIRVLSRLLTLAALCALVISATPERTALPSVASSEAGSLKESPRHALILPRLQVSPTMWQHLETLGFHCPYVRWKNADKEFHQRPALAAVGPTNADLYLPGASLTLPPLNPGICGLLLALTALILGWLLRLRHSPTASKRQNGPSSHNP